MRVLPSLASLVLLSVVHATAAGQPPPVDSLLEKLDGVQKQRAELSKQADDLTKEIRSRLRSMASKLEELTGQVVNPPSPVTPPGPAPVPADPFRKKIADAFSLDPGQPSQKKADAVQLAALYSVAVDQKLADDPALTTVGQLIARVRSAGQTLAADRLAGVRKVIGDEMAAVLKDPSLELTPDKRKAASELFARIETALDEVAK
jgi:hypothetical protein